jgi:NADPH:quinone reductase-like Zn-dependent oxidoreductase
MKIVFCTQYGGPSVLQVKETSVILPNEDEVIVKNRASAITTADTFLRKGEPKFGRLFIGLRKPKNPKVGTGFAGVISQAGKNVTNFKVGDNVYGETLFDFGANAEYVCINTKKCVMQHIQKNVTFNEAASICDGALTSYNFLIDMAKIKANQHVLIIGASGSLGTAGIQIAKSIEAKVTAVCSGANKELVKSLGADEVIDYKTYDFTKNINKYDVIYDSIGASSFNDSKKALKKKGIYLTPVLKGSLLCPIIRTSIAGGKKAKFQATGLKKVPKLNEFLSQINVLLEGQKLKMIIDKTYTIDEVVEAHKYIDSGRKKGNIVMVFDA